jgi:hypothetical protein
MTKTERFLFKLLAVAVILTNVGLLTHPSPVHGQASNNGIPNYTLGVDPCQSSGTIKSNAVINVVTATTTQLVALSGTKTIYVCGYSFTIDSSATSAATALIEYGTGASCGTGTTALTGTYGTATATAGPAILIIPGPYAGTAFSTAAGNALCILTAGTTVNVQGQLTYVQL